MSNKTPTKTNRRDSFKAAAAASAVAVPYFVPGAALGIGPGVAPSERIVLGGLGIGPRGTKDLACFLANSDVQFVASRRSAVDAS